MRNRYMVFCILAFSSLWLKPVMAVEVNQSDLSQNAILIHLSASEVAEAKKGVAASTRVAEQVTGDVLRMAGLPGSITGKVAMAAAWPGIITRFATGIYTSAKNTSAGQNMTLKFHNINVGGVRKVWEASAAGDLAMPAGKEQKVVMEIINIFSNVVVN